MDLFDMPDYEHTEDESFPPLPPPLSPGQGGEDHPFGEEGELSQLAEVPAAKRKGVRRPQPKLDSNRLVSERGLPSLRTLFDNVHFKGRGHETEDLRLLMHKMENWAHRLYPKMQFEDFIDKVEKLGAKKDVQTCVKRIRLDMPLTHEDFIGKDGEEDMGVRREEQDFGEPDPFGGGGGGGVFPDEPQGPVHSTPAPAPAPAFHSTPASSSSSAPSLTEEQRQRMERNKQLALEKRLARKQQLLLQQTDVSASQPVSSSVMAEEVPTSSSQRANQAEDVDQGHQAQDVDQGDQASVQAQDVKLEDLDKAKDMDQGHQAKDVEQGDQASDQTEDVDMGDQASDQAKDVDQGDQAEDVDMADQASDQAPDQASVQAQDVNLEDQAKDVDQGDHASVQATDVDQGDHASVQATDVDQGDQAAYEKRNQSSGVEGAFKSPHKDSLLLPECPPCGAVPQLSDV